MFCVIAVGSILAPLTTNASKKLIAVLEFSADERATLSPDEVSHITNLVRQNALRLTTGSEYKLMTRENIAALLPPGTDLAQCEVDAKCEVEIGRNVGADYVITGRIIKFGKTLTISMNVHNTRTANLVASDSAVTKKIDEVLEPLKEAVGRLFERLIPTTGQTARNDPDAGSATGPVETDVIDLTTERNQVEDVFQPKTGLRWMRCALGLEYRQERCQGTPSKFRWNNAMSACPTGYRMPSREEFMTLLGHCDGNMKSGNHGSCSPCSRGDCRRILGNDTLSYWTETTENPMFSWKVSLDTGYVGIYGVGFELAVRCVRESIP